MPDETIAVVDDARFDAHTARGAHPERPERLDAARAGLRSAVDAGSIRPIEAIEIDAAPLRAVHEAGYLERLERTLSEGWGHLDADTFCSPGSREAAHRAAGGAAELARALLGDVRRGVALLRPPGHHAEADRAMGFCMINNVAVAAEAARAAGAARVAIVDWDVHHGNGTQHIFEARDDVLFVSLHQFPHYPGTGAPREIGRGAGLGRTINLAMPARCGDEDYGAAFREVVLPALRAHAPDLILVSAGYDAHARDPLASMELSTDVYGAMASAIVEVAEGLGHGRVGLLLEGGYDLAALEGSVAASARAALGQRLALPESAPSAAGANAIAQTRAALEPVWPEVFAPA